jgi:Fe-S oxidoreductase
MDGTAKIEERLDFLDRCMRCSHCKFVTTPKSQEFASVCPSIDYGEFHAYSASGQLIMASGLLHGEIDYTDRLTEIVSACTMCGGCDPSCKLNFGETVEPLDGLYAFRAKIVADGRSPDAHKDIVTRIGKTGNVQGNPAARRADWTEGLTGTLAADGACDVLLHVGSVLSFDDAKHATLRRIADTLLQSGIRLGYLGAEEGSSGSTAFDLGYQDEARRLGQIFLRQVQNSGATTVVTLSSAALAAYRALYPRLGLSFGKVRVLHITEYLLELADAGTILLDKSTEASAPIAYHDPCKLGRLSELWEPRDLSLERVPAGIYISKAPDKLRYGNNGMYEAPREILRRIGLEVVELERNRHSSFCCGANGGVAEAVPEAASKAAHSRLAELPQTGCATMVSGCGNCASHMNRNAEGAAVVDLLDMVAASLQAGKGT